MPVREMRTPPAGVTQRPFNRAQAEEYAADFDPDKFGILVVNFRDGVYWVLDGQHRLWALKKWFGDSDPGSIECEVYEGLTDQEMADIFLGRDNRRAISPLDKFLVACTAERPRECEIKRTVEANHCRVSRNANTNSIGAVSALGRVYDRNGPLVLGQVIRTIRDAYGGDPHAFEQDLIVGLGMIYNRYNGKTSEQRLVTQLAAVKHGVRGVKQRAVAQQERTGAQKAHCMAAAIVDLYNHGLKALKERLPSWWRMDCDKQAQAS